MHHLAQAWGLGGDWQKFSGVLSRESFGASIPSLGTNPDLSLVVPSSGTRAAPTGSDTGAIAQVKSPSMHILGVDLEKCASSVLFQGLNTRATPPFVEYTFGVATTATATCYGFAISDVVIEVDIGSRSVVAYI
jgi:hypothetical protein